MISPRLSVVLCLSFSLAVWPAAPRAQESKAYFDAAVAVLPTTRPVHSVGDFDGDGMVDAVGWWWTDVNKDEVRVSSFFGAGDGTFPSWSNSVVPYSGDADQLAWALEVGQFDGIAGDDFVIALDTEVRVYNSVPGAVHSLIAQFGTIDKVRSAAVIDYDSDGLDDLLLAGNGVRLFRNTGLGFSEVASTAHGDDIALADVDGVPGLDVLSRWGNQVDVLSLAGGTLSLVYSFQQDLPESSAPKMVPGDIDGDGDDDVVIFAESPAIYRVHRQTAPGVLQTEATRVGGPASDLIDIDGDGDLDGLCCGGSGGGSFGNDVASTFRIALNDGTGVFDDGWSIDGIGAMRLAGAADFDQDGDLDLLAGAALYFNRESFSGGEVQPTVGIGNIRFPGDRDSDGDPDGPGLMPGLMSGFRNDGAGAVASHLLVRPASPAGTSWTTPEVLIDVDGDGDLDSLVKGSDLGHSLRMRLHVNTGGGGYVDGGWATALGEALVDPNAIVGDFDEDGFQDIVSWKSFTRRVWLNDGTGSFTLTSYPSTTWHHSQAADFDGDGHLDILDRSLSVLYGAGDGTFSAGVPVLSAPLGQFSLWRVTVGHLDDNNFPDILYHKGNSTYRVLNDGQGFTNYTVSYNFSLDRLGIADCNGDGHPDILLGQRIQTATSYTWVTDVLLGDGTGLVFASPVRQIFPLDQLVDVDGDGDLDVSAANQTRGMVVFNNASHPSESGTRRQYGLQSPGFGGMVPTLGATGPFTVGEQVTLRLVGGAGAALAVLLAAPSATVSPGWPAPGLEGYVPGNALARFLFLSGSADVPGSGSQLLTFNVPAAFAGLKVTLQAYMQDMSAPFWLTQTNALELAFE